MTEERDWLAEAIRLATYDIEEPAPPVLTWEHLRAIWDMQTTMTLRMADVHARAQRAEQLTESFRVELGIAQQRLKIAHDDVHAWKAKAIKAEAELEDALGHVVMVEPDAMEAGKRYNREQDEAHEERQKGDGES